MVNGATDHPERPMHLDVFTQPEWPDNDLHAHCGGLGSDLRRELPLGDYTPGRWGWLLTDVEQTRHVPVKGRQGVFQLDDAVLAGAPAPSGSVSQ